MCLQTIYRAFEGSSITHKTYSLQNDFTGSIYKTYANPARY